MSKSTVGRVFAIVVLSIAVSGAVNAQNRLFVGARNLGMGNAGVGFTTDALAVYFNPAGMAFNSGWEVQLPLITVDADIGSDVFEQIDEVLNTFTDVSLDELQARFDAGTATEDDLATLFAAFLYEVPDLAGAGAGGTLRGSTGPAFRWKNWGVSVAVIGNGGAEAVVDLENGLSLSQTLNYGAVPADGTCSGESNCETLAADLIALSSGQLSQAQAETLAEAAGPEVFDDPQARDVLDRIVTATGGSDSSLAENESGASTTTLVGVQLAGTYSRKIWRDKLSVGANLKLIQGEASRVSTVVADLQSGQDTFEDTLDGLSDGTTSTELALDVGFMYKPSHKWSVGLVGNNLNSPDFEYGSGGSFELEPLVRVGGAWAPLKWFNVALDVDLNEIDSQTIPSIGYQYWNLGAEFLIGRIVSIWAGAYQNFASSFSDPIYTGGLGLRFGRFQLALSAAVSSGSVGIEEGDSFPSGAGAALTFAWLPKRG